MPQVSPHGRLLPLAGAAVLVGLWFVTFPIERPLDVGDVVFEGLYLLAAVATFELVRRVGVTVLSLGWAVFVGGLLIDFLDEFTTEPALVDTYAEGALTAGGLLLIGYGAYIAVRRYEALLDEQADTADALAHQHDRLDRFTRAITHDLQSPLTVAIGRLELAREDHESEHLDAVGRALERMGDLLDDLMTMASVGGSEPTPEPVDPGRLAEECWEHISTGEASLEVDVDRPIRADRDRLQQVLENLFVNAVTHGGEAVTVAVSETPEGFVVEDDGLGVPPADHEQVFEGGYSTAETGTGLGLSIVDQIATAHGWEVSLTGSDDGGARFEFSGVDFVD